MIAVDAADRQMPSGLCLLPHDLLQRRKSAHAPLLSCCVTFALSKIKLIVRAALQSIPASCIHIDLISSDDTHSPNIARARI